jgi:hypothetical protein
MVTTKTKNLSQTEVKELINNILKLLHENIQEDVIPDSSVWEKFFAKNYQFISNGVLKCRNINDYLRRYEHLQDTYSHIKFSGPIEDLVISGNQFTLHQSIDLVRHDGSKFQVLMMAIGTVENGKLFRWVQVTHETGIRDWDE